MGIVARDANRQASQIGDPIAITGIKNGVGQLAARERFLINQMEPIPHDADHARLLVQLSLAFATRCFQTLNSFVKRELLPLVNMDQ